MRAPIALVALVLASLALAHPAAARDSLGVFGSWGAFRDPQVPRCYAIAAAETSARARDFDAFASIGTWPRERIRGQFHLRLSRRVASEATVTLRIGADSFTLIGNGGNAWAQGAQADAAILAAIRSAARMTVSARDQRGRAFTDSYSLEGAATAMDAASVACVR